MWCGSLGFSDAQLIPCNYKHLILVCYGDCILITDVLCIYCENSKCMFNRHYAITASTFLRRLLARLLERCDHTPHASCPLYDMGFGRQTYI